MKKIFKRIWELALPYQDHRDDKGHAEITLQYALRLVDKGQGNADVVVPAIILHDVGWSRLSQEGRFLIFNKNATDEEKLAARIQHQNAGVELARELLNQVKYPPDLTEEILEIISEHDTRKGFISINEGLVRDADKLWRFSKVGFEAGVTRNKAKYESRCQELEASIARSGYFSSETARQIALEEIKLRKSFK